MADVGDGNGDVAFSVVLVDARCWNRGGRRPIVGEWRDNTDRGDVSSHTHTLPIDTVLSVSSTTTYLSVKSQFLGVS